MRDIHFGTDGWRGIIAKDFTFENVSRVAQAIANFLASPKRKRLEIYKKWGVSYRPPESGVVVGYDTRFLSREFAIQVGRVLKSNGIPAYISNAPVPSPVLSYAVAHKKLACGIMITSSHNSPEYNGIKIKPEFGGSAPPQVTQLIESFVGDTFLLNASDEELEEIDLKTPYLARIKELLNLEALRGAPLRVIVDPMYGSAQGYVAQILEELGIKHIQIRSRIDPYFGGKNPEPIEKNLGPLRAVIASESLKTKKDEILIGVATDGDGDRVAGMDEQGNLIDSHRCYALIFQHLLGMGWRGKAVKSFTLTDMANKIAQKNKIALEEVPVGFKYICEKMLRDDVLIGGEESGGIGIKNHIPERDGMLMSLLLLEIAATHQKPMSQIIDGMMQEIGHHYYDRKDLHLEKRLEFVERLKCKPPERFAERVVQAVETLDGVKLRFNDGWLLFRASGTEPLLRIYCEMDSEQKVQEVLAEAERFARGDLKLWLG